MVREGRGNEEERRVKADSNVGKEKKKKKKKGRRISDHGLRSIQSWESVNSYRWCRHTRRSSYREDSAIPERDGGSSSSEDE